MSSLVTKLKVTIGSILANNTTGGIISSAFKGRIPFHNTKIDVSDPNINNHTKASIFWHFYETDEVKYAQKYLTANEDFVELGSSIGVMGSIVSQIQKSGKYIAVEANPKLINAIKTNFSINRKANYTLLNKAVDYFNKTVSFSVNESNLVGQVDRTGSATSTVTVDAITLDEICIANNLTSYTLLSDIEGAEITFLLNDAAALSKCSKIIIELHDTEYNGNDYSVNDMVQLIIDHGFTIIDQRSPVFVFQKK